jgi:hypothetical protein
MAWIKGFPNESTQVLDVPMYTATLAQADLATDLYVGMPVGATVLTGAYAGGNGAYIMKTSTVAGDYTDWKYLSRDTNTGDSL